MFKKIISGIGLMAIIALPFVMKAQGTSSNQNLTSLESLSREQLIKVITCLTQDNRDRGSKSSLDRCIATVVPKPSVSVLTPNGGEKITAGTSTQIRWQTNTGTSTPVQIYLERVGSKIQTLIASNIENSGSYTWIPQVSTSAGTSTAYKIGVKVGTVNQSAYDTSDSPFLIISNTPTTPWPQENTASLCSDGIDNDNDLITDLSDPDCARFESIATTTIPATLIVYQPATQNIPSVQHNTGGPISLVQFNAKAESASTVINSVTVSTLQGTNIPSSYLQLYDGSTLLAVATSTRGNAIFTNLYIPITKDTVKQLTVKGVYSLTPNQITQWSVTNVRYTLTPGVYNNSSSPVVGPLITLGTKVALFTATTVPTITQVTQGTSSYSIVKFEGTITARGGNMVAPKTGDIGIVFKSPQHTIRTTATTTIVITPNLSTIAEGMTVNFTAQSVLDNRNVPASGIYQAMIDSIRWKIDNVDFTQTSGLDQFKTIAGVSIVK